MSESTDHTHHTRFRIPRVMWDAYGRVTERLDTNRTARLLDHVRADITQYGDERDLADLAKAEEELTERRARKGGRPRKAETDPTGHSEGT
jgi:YD repeat-containing protein